MGLPPEEAGEDVPGGLKGHALVETRHGERSRRRTPGNLCACACAGRLPSGARRA